MELGMLLTARQELLQLRGLQCVCRMFAVEFGQGLPGVQAAEYHCVVLVHGSQVMQKSKQLLHNLHQSSTVPCGKPRARLCKGRGALYTEEMAAENWACRPWDSVRLRHRGLVPLPPVLSSSKRCAW